MPALSRPASPAPAGIRLIGAACGLGAPDPACGDGPMAFHRSQAAQELVRYPEIDWGRMLFPATGSDMSVVARIAEFNRRLAAEVRHARSEGVLPLVLGGDHSVAIGTWSGVAAATAAPVGLLWVDAHLDSHTPSSTYSGAIHGMPLACLLGRGDKRLLQLGLPQPPQLQPAHVAVLGARSHEPEERALLDRLGVRVWSAADIQREGFDACCAAALQVVAAAPGGFGVSIDIDAIDPRLAPGVGSPEPGGLAVSDLLSLVALAGGAPGFLALEIAEFNPDRDRYGETAALIAELIVALRDAALPPQGAPDA